MYRFDIRGQIRALYEKLKALRSETPRSDGTWKAPPVPTLALMLAANRSPEWQLVHPT